MSPIASRQPAEQTAITSRSVFSSLGYPNFRNEQTREQIGWQGLKAHELTNVSRETFSKERV